MLAELKFVQGAVAKKDFLPALTHFRIENGEVRSYNGTLALSSPIAFDIDCTPKAAPFVKAIQNCKETVSMSMTPAGRLSIKSGSFKAFIECVDTETPHVMPEGERIEIDGEALLAGIKTVAPFVSDDASRPWSNGVLFSGESLYATNNIVLVEYWIGARFPIVCNVPRAAIKEMIRINEPPIYAQSTDQSISFHYSDGRWIRSALYETDWPDLAKVLNRETNPFTINEEIFEALETIKPFVDKIGRVYFNKGAIKTSLDQGEGASYEIEGLDVEGVYQLHMLALLKDVATTIDLSCYPNPCIFYGDRLRGAIIGLKS